jgi:hypothetical protein
MQQRYKKRVPLKASVTFCNGELRGEERVLDFTAPGCLIESTQKVVKGQYLQLQVLLPGQSSSFTVQLAAVRWTKGTRFGVEFIRMGKSEEQIMLSLAE